VKGYQEALYEIPGKKIQPSLIERDLTIAVFGTEKPNNWSSGIKKTQINPRSEGVKTEKGVKTKKSDRNVKSQELLQTWVVDQAFEAPIRDQGKRPTCAAFSAIHAIEIVMRQNRYPEDLSEQFFYYASKPKCRRSPCNRRGSWVNSGIRYASDNAIPLEKNCPYSKKHQATNETQVPLARSCFKGRVQVVKHRKLRDLNDIARALKDNLPVVGGFKLTENFYINQGLVLLSEAGGLSQKAHAKGHALTLIGIMELPQSLKKTEGDICFLVANSWSTGWGIGGHACLSVNWVKRFRFPIEFVAIEKLGLKTAI
jgi:hypothetical protein